MAARKKKDKKPPPGPALKVVARNRRARFDYHLEEEVEAGISLLGTEVKSLREGRASLEQAWCRVQDGEVFLVGANIPAYGAASWSNHEPTRTRKLLLHRRQIRRITQALRQEGRTLVPVRIYFNEAGRVKVLIALATGKKRHDKRESIARREAAREIQRALKHRR